MKKHTLLLACAMRILLNLIALPIGAVYPAPMARPFFKGLLSGHAI